MLSLSKFMDAEGRITRWPTRKGERLFGQQLVVEYLITKFEAGRTYTEREVNDILRQWHTFEDWAILRREMFERDLLGRTPDGRRYWVITQPESAEA
ncbi:MAG: DUF2087 domain-containing protein [Anaerolineae bacterium]|jgi:hypothetical protein|nr:DUF2087 domain-containing protein [Anaerolineae bacterium]